MTPKSCLAALAAVAVAAATLSLGAAPLTETAAVQARPDPSSPIVSYLKAGSEPVAASVPAPDGWMAVQVQGPIDVYVRNEDLTKGLEVRSGSPLYLAPDASGGSIGNSTKDEKLVITGVRGNWTRLSLEGGFVGYIQSGVPAEAPATASTLSALSTGSGPAAGSGPVAGSGPEAAVSTAPGRPAPGFAQGDDDAALFPRVMDGRFESTKNLLPFHKPYAWQLVDDAGNRRAYLDVSKLLETDQIDRYVNRQVEVSGTLTSLPNGNLVVVVQNLSLK